MGEVTPIRRRPKVSAVTFEPPPTPESVLRELFRKEAEYESELRAIRTRMGLARRLYADQHKLLMLPGIEQLRRIFGQ